MTTLRKYIFGYHSVLSCIQKHPESVCNIYLQKGKIFDSNSAIIQKYINKNLFKTKDLSKSELNSLVNNARHQGIVAEIIEAEQIVMENDLEAILDTIQETAFILILDGVQDPHNLGACLRSANAAGAHLVIAPKDNAVGLTAVVHKVASGAVDHTPFIQVTNLARTLRMLKERGIWIFGSDERAIETIFEANFKISLALVLGAEGTGIRRLTKDNCDFLVRIPMQGVVPSLNVSVAAGVCMFEVLRQRKAF
jgi:23S rRNA (guanosine2251-2'-O)-methyltransferase